MSEDTLLARAIQKFRTSRLIQRAVAGSRLAPRPRLRLAGDPRHIRWPKRVKRAMLGCKRPRICPVCRQYTRQSWMESLKGAWRCWSCGHVFKDGKVIVSREEANIVPWNLDKRYQAEDRRDRLNARLARRGSLQARKNRELHG